MGIDYTSYVVVGSVKKKYTDEDYDVAEDVESLEDGVSLIVDGMCGEYIVLGKVISSYDQYDCGGEFDEMKTSDLEKTIADIEEKLNKHKDKMNGWSEVKLFSFMHVS